MPALLYNIVSLELGKYQRGEQFAKGEFKVFSALTSKFQVIVSIKECLS